MLGNENQVSGAKVAIDGCGILVVYDDRDYAEAQAEVLELNGYAPIVAHSFNGALEAVSDSRPRAFCE